MSKADAASYQAEIFNYCEERRIKYAIGAHIDKTVKEAILSIPVCQQADRRWKLYNIAGRIVYHRRKVFLKVRNYAYSIFKEIRRKTWIFCCNSS